MKSRVIIEVETPEPFTDMDVDFDVASVDGIFVWRVLSIEQDETIPDFEDEPDETIPEL